MVVSASPPPALREAICRIAWKAFILPGPEPAHHRQGHLACSPATPPALSGLELLLPGSAEKLFVHFSTGIFQVSSMEKNAVPKLCCANTCAVPASSSWSGSPSRQLESRQFSGLCNHQNHGKQRMNHREEWRMGWCSYDSP